MRHELAADEGHQQQGRQEDQGRDQHGCLGVVERPIQLHCVFPLHPFVGAIRFLVDALLEPVGGEHGYQRKRQDERADQRKRHGLSHGVKQFARRPAQRINRQIPGEDDGHRIENRAIHILGRRENHFVQAVLLSFPQRQFAVDVFHHDHGARPVVCRARARVP